MSELRIESWTMPGADLGPENPLPPLGAHQEAHVPQKIPGVPQDMMQNMAYGRVASILPYTVQDGYTRDLHPRTFRVAVLENEILRATFLLELGGRLRSLVHKPTGRELLAANPIFQPANLAIRNAWFSGGVEWNVGLTGHCPFTCSPLFAARVHDEDGTPILRMYEWERIRQVPFQIDAYLPAASPVLLVRVRLVNPHRHPVPMYWWSNMAVPESADTRVLVPATTAYSFGYGKGGLRAVPVPEVGGTDISYATHVDRAADFFFHIPDGERPWIAALDAEGKGLVQVSTAQLLGRKLFLWGMGPGGRRWQRFLSLPDHPYLEIQAGLARTQMEHLPMPSGVEWSWLEAYGLMEAEPSAVHGRDWQHARQAAARGLEQLIPGGWLDAEYRRGTAFADRVPEELYQHGSGWGTLERLRREAEEEPPFSSLALPFDDDALGAAQMPWLGLLQDGAMPAADPNEAPTGYVVQAEWRTLLEKALSAGRGTHWLSWLYLGVMRAYAGERDGARQAWERSLQSCRTPWALRNLAVLAREDGRADNAVALYVDALRMCPSLLPLAVECGRALTDLGRHAEWLELVQQLPEAVRARGRIRLLEGQAALAVSDLPRVERLLGEGLVIEDLREGERSLSHLWFEYHEQRLSRAEQAPIDDALRARVRREFPVPDEIDFRMSSDV
jgi:tetratricopeptide (TPR) repeat protein